MSPAKRKEKLIQIDKKRFKELVSNSDKTQKEIAENVLYTSEAYFSRKLTQGIIDKDWLYRIADYLNVSRSYLSGESDQPLTRLAERREKITEADPRILLNEFMISRGFPDHYCDDITEDELADIEGYVYTTVKYHKNMISEMVNYGIELENHIKKLETRIKTLEDNSSLDS